MVHTTFIYVHILGSKSVWLFLCCLNNKENRRDVRCNKIEFFWYFPEFRVSIFPNIIKGFFRGSRGQNRPRHAKLYRTVLFRALETNFYYTRGPDEIGQLNKIETAIYINRYINIWLFPFCLNNKEKRRAVRGDKSEFLFFRISSFDFSKK